MDVLLLMALILLNGVFAMSEIALVAVRSGRLKQLSDHSHSARTALILKENPTLFLSTIQIGITAIGLLNGIVGEATLSEPFELWLIRQGMEPKIANLFSTGCVVIVITYFSIVIGELVPKRYAQANAERISIIVARPIHLLSKITIPFVALLTASTEGLLRIIGQSQNATECVTEEDVQAIVNEGSESGALDPKEHDMIHNIMRLNDRPASSLMTPRRDVDYLDIDRPLDEVMQRIRETRHKVFPVCHGHLDNLIGTISSKAMLNRSNTLSVNALTGMAKVALYIPETMKGLQLLNHMQTTSTEMVFVVDEYGDLQGLITLYDILEAIAGELSLEPAEAWMVTQPDGSLLVDAMIPVSELKQRLNLTALADEDQHGYQTLSGMLLWLSGELPEKGETVYWDDWQFRIEGVEQNRVTKVRITRKEFSTANQKPD
ncbi:hemolysin family protein [Vibrio sp. V39_P1S14PM300]|uniref:hemolysin family protein n=1 Tax=Vibrio sp. V39_P1S14PM300 TaxID=1938690 RepID=UPI001372819A|nr:hemolysin family protein [Vibrio sp. V39_P1S14PM300]NAX23430.1 DUF21 domain-containing protein [Vibrio sp. V39_P1S14PM300]